MGFFAIVLRVCFPRRTNRMKLYNQSRPVRLFYWGNLMRIYQMGRLNTDAKACVRSVREIVKNNIRKGYGFLYRVK